MVVNIFDTSWIRRDASSALCYTQVKQTREDLFEYTRMLESDDEDEDARLLQMPKPVEAMIRFTNTARERYEEEDEEHDEGYEDEEDYERDYAEYKDNETREERLLRFRQEREERKSVKREILEMAHDESSRRSSERLKRIMSLMKTREEGSARRKQLVRLKKEEQARAKRRLPRYYYFALGLKIEVDLFALSPDIRSEVTLKKVADKTLKARYMPYRVRQIFKRELDWSTFKWSLAHESELLEHGPSVNWSQVNWNRLSLAMFEKCFQYCPAARRHHLIASRQHEGFSRAFVTKYRSCFSAEWRMKQN